ncbi:DUF2865 domain-containing protein [Alsobacter sp. R-9]
MRILRGGWLAIAIMAASAGAAAAQSAYCDRLRGDIAALERAGGGRSPQMAAELRRQQLELDRTVSYARSIGCQRQRFLMFGEPPPPQCGPLQAQINRMESNLAALESQADRYAGGAIEAQRAALVAAYDTNCRGLPPQPARSTPGLFERLFGGQQESDPVTEMDPGGAPFDEFGGGAIKTLCVRKCDGYYFPISTRTSRGAFENDSAICQASCPAAEVELFMQPADGSADQAISADGTPYSSLPNAFRYRQTYDNTCSCRRPGQSWSEALADAERLVSTRKTDIIVTEQKSQEMSRPREATPAAPAATQRGNQQQRPAARSGNQAAPAATATPAAPPAAAPAATATGRSPAAPAPSAETIRPDGSRVRVVAPTLGPAPTTPRQ